ncbi:non-homologous end-joining DNA ligase [Dethiobacter alkaliphilus]|uniref:non-homologous end-joining DNA ligase n=1 Tax=Dethiobacter alkaliphilus TaxID=427926 RepID=UPI002226C377|nr:non-homologous end-joining DNA ligase [Dethiobacter alkaliphilus]MCW3491438.1 non-homologous end-joining DNA ligase [Dethiobacter alkaliphilus]
MEPVMASGVPQASDLLYQVKWDGVRMLAHVGHGKIMLHNRKLRQRTGHYPELSRLGQLLQGEAILDGEIVALKDGRPSFPLILERDLIGGSGEPDPGKVRQRARQVPVFYMVFDLIYHNGRDLTALPLSQRQALLAEILPKDETVQTVESFTDGEALFAAVSENKMEGIVAKEPNSLYQRGKKNAAWKKIKVRQRQLVAIGGYTVKDGQINALLAGAYHQGQLVYLGRVATGLRGQDIRELTPFLNESLQTAPPFVNASPARDRVWVEPRLVALIDFQEWTEDLRMRQPVIKGFTKDRPEDCVLQ